MNTPHAHDVVVIGSGCTGGAAAWQLSRRGLRVLVLEAGDHVTPQDSETDAGLPATLNRIWRVLISRRQQTQSLHPAYWLYPPRLFVDDRNHPYSTPEGRPFVWIRGRQVGGRSLTWSGVALRLSADELQDWPLSYGDLAPHYDEIEQLMGVCGSADHLPQLPDGNFRPAKPLTPAELVFRERLMSRWPERRLIASRGVDSTTTGQWSSKSSLGSTIAAAQRTGLVDLRANAVARRVVVDESTGRAKGVEVFDTKAKTTGIIPARALVVCASTLESVKLLLNSRSAACPDGLGNSSGLLGRCIMNKVSRSVTFELPLDGADVIHPLSAADSFIIPRYRNLGTQTDEFGGGFGVWGAIQRMAHPRHTGASAPGSAFGILVGYGESLPYPDNKVELRSDVRDRWGAPAAHIDVRWRENEQRMAARIDEDLRQMVSEVGGTVVPPATSRQPLRRHLAGRVFKASSVPGAFVHEMGGARMGSSPHDSVVDERCQLWDCSNVFITDGACWPSSGWQNPTLTMMAITARSCVFIADRFASGDL